MRAGTPVLTAKDKRRDTALFDSSCFIQPSDFLGVGDLFCRIGFKVIVAAVRQRPFSANEKCGLA